MRGARRALLFDIGNTNTHVGIASEDRILQNRDIPTAAWRDGTGARLLRTFLRSRRIDALCVCSVVPGSTPRVLSAARLLCGASTPVTRLCPETLLGVGVDFPRPQSIGQDRLANSLAAKLRYGAPVLVVGFGTAVAFDVVDKHGNYVGGIIAPGLAAMTDYLHEKTALLPRIRIRDTRGVIGKSTAEAMRIGALHGYRGLVRELIGRVKQELQAPALPVVATGGYARLMARGIREITAVEPLLTLEGLRRHWLSNRLRP
ncbi:MAG: type III pantothenate kinase [Verrucomicrobia bacterium]|nr:type III pantothenate kinase [Verrucomicrobiota bacterium]MBI3867853.1 type III pantothenate kinase [Verrucomicrobiota bacterium]